MSACFSARIALLHRCGLPLTLIIKIHLNVDLNLRGCGEYLMMNLTPCCFYIVLKRMFTASIHSTHVDMEPANVILTFLQSFRWLILL